MVTCVATGVNVGSYLAVQLVWRRQRWSQSMERTCLVARERRGLSSTSTLTLITATELSLTLYCLASPIPR